MEVTKDISQPEIRVILDYWLGKRGADVVPSVKAINPAEIDPNLLPWLFLFRRDDNGRFRCSLAGTGIVRVDGYDSTGRYLDEVLDGDEKEERLKLFDHVVHTGMPLCYRGRRRMASKAERGFTRLLLPVSGGGAIDHVFGIIRFGPVDLPVSPRKARAGRLPNVTVRGKTLPGFGAATTVTSG